MLGLDPKRKIIKRRRRLCGPAEQRQWPVIVDSLETFARLQDHEPKENMIVFVFCSKAELMQTNLTPFAPSQANLTESLKYALTNLDQDPFVFERYAPTLIQYVNHASKPSALSDLTTIIFRISPYAFRKEVQAAVPQYLAGRMTDNALNKMLTKTLRGDEIRAMLDTEECKALKAAVSEVLSGANPDLVGPKFNIDPFDINYVLHSIKKE